MYKQGGWNGLTVLILVAVFLAGGFLTARAQAPARAESAVGTWQIIQKVQDSVATRAYKLNTVTGESWWFLIPDPRPGTRRDATWIPIEPKQGN